MTIWFVDDSVVAGGSGTSAGEAFQTIGAAIAAAGSGDTIIVLAGTYAEDVVINKSLTLLSQDGSASTIIDGRHGQQGAITVTNGVNNVTIGGIGTGFTVLGNNGNGAVEMAAIYLDDAHTSITIQGNTLVARGDAALMSEYGMAVSHVVIDHNVITGQTFEGTQPTGEGSSTQFVVGNNVPRQLVVFGSGANTTTTHHITFTDNEVSGTAGGINSAGHQQGNNLVTIDALNSTIQGNTFSGFTNYGAAALRTRSDYTTISNNTFDADAKDSPDTVRVTMQNNGHGTFASNTFVQIDGSTVFQGSDGTDNMVGTTGDDTFLASAGNDTIDGLSGSDTYDLSANTTGAFVDLGSDANGSGGMAFGGTQTGFDSLASIENVRGSSGNDVLNGSAADNVFYTSAGNDQIDGGEGGIDTYDASGTANGVTINLATHAATGAEIGSDTLANIHNAVGGAGNDTITGDGVGNRLVGNGGADALNGGGGGDVLEGGTGGDSIDGGAGSDTIYGGGVATDDANTTLDMATGYGAGYVLSWQADHWQVSNGVDADALHGIEKVMIDGHTYLLVDKTANGGFSTIQEAIGAASSGNTILVADGTYREQVSVDGLDHLTIRAVDGAANTTIEMVNAPQVTHDYLTEGGSKDRYAVVTVHESNDVTLEGFTIDGRGLGDMVAGSSDYEGVLYYNASGSIEDLAVVGVRDALNGDGTIKGNQRGNAILVLSDDSVARSVEIADNNVSDFQKNAITVSGVGLTADVNHNTVTGAGFLPATNAMAQNGIQISYGAGGTVDHNTVGEIGLQRGDWSSSSILAYQAADGLHVTNNILNGATLAGIPQASVNNAIAVVGETDDVVVTGNAVASQTFGIILYSDIDNPTVSANTFTDMFAAVTTNTGQGTFSGENYGVYGDLNDAAFNVTLSDGVDEILGTPFADTIDAGGGGDRIDGGAGNDAINAGAGNDQIDGGSGADNLTGGTGDDTFFVNDSGDQVHEAAGGGSDTVIASASFALAAGEEVEILQATNSSASLELTGNEYAQTISGNAGADFLAGAGGDDVLHGGTGIDTARFGDDIANATFAPGTTAGTFIVTTVDGSDTLDGIEALQFNGGARVLVVGAGSAFETIQSAVDAAQSGDTILVTAGHYAEQVTINASPTLANLTILGFGADTVIEAPVALADNTTGRYGEPSVALFAVNGVDVTIKNLSFDGLGKGDLVAGHEFSAINVHNADATIDHIDASGFRGALVGGHVPGYQNGRPILILSDGSADHDVSITNSTIEDFQKNGIDIRGTGITALVSHNIITGDGLIPGDGAMAQNGIVLGFGAAGTVEFNTISEIGNARAGDSAATGILIYQAADGVVVDHNQVTGASGTNTTLGVSVYDSNGVDVTDNTLSHVDHGIDATGGVDGLSHSGNGFADIGSNNLYYDGADNAAPLAGASTLAPTDGPDTIIGTSQADTITGAGGNDALIGGAGADTLDGGAGSDTLYGNNATGDEPNAAVDTAEFGAGFTLSWHTDHWEASNGADTDSLYGIEKVAVDGQIYLLVDQNANGGFSTIQSAINAAVGGETILVAAGTYAESVDVNKSVTLIGDPGPSNGIGTGALAPHLVGGAAFSLATISITAPHVTVSGLDVSNGTGPYGIFVEAGDAEITNNRVHDINGHLSGDGIRGIYIQPYSNIVVANNIVEDFGNDDFPGARSYTQVASGIFVWARGASLPGGIGNIPEFSNISIQNNIIRDPGMQFDGTSVFGIWAGGSGSGAHIDGLNIIGNQISDLHSAYTVRGFFLNHGVGAGGYTSDLVVSGNTITDLSGASVRAIGLEGNTPSAEVIENVINNLDLTPGSTGYVAALWFEDNPGTSSVSLHDIDPLHDNDFGGYSVAQAGSDSVADTIHAIEGYDNILLGRGGGDTLVGGDYNDIVVGGDGNDTLHGGGGADDLIGGNGNDTATYDTAITASMITAVTDVDPVMAGNQAGWQIATGGVEGSDLLNGIEIIDGAEAGRTLIVGNGGFATIQAAIDAAQAGDVVLVADGTYAENVTLKDSVSVRGESQAGVVLTGGLITPADFGHATISNMTIQNSGSSMLLDMRQTHDVTDAVFADLTFNLTGDFVGNGTKGYVPLGNGQVDQTMLLHDADNDLNGLSFNSVTFNSNNHLSGDVAFVYTTVNSDNGALLSLDDVHLTGTASGSATGLGAQWNMTQGNASASVSITNSFTSAGGNFYVSGFDGVTVTGNDFAGQGIALNGVTDALVDGNVFHDIHDTITANGIQHRGLVIENAWGTDGVSGVTITNNTFQNIDSLDGAIAFQRWNTVGDTATVDLLNTVDIESNTFTNLGAGVAPIYLNAASFGPGAILPADFAGAQVIIGTSGDDTITDTSSGTMEIFADGGADTVTAGEGIDIIHGGDGVDTIIGGAGDDIIHGDAGADDLAGGTGNDIYYADGSDQITELNGDGTDQVISTESITLSADVENLTLTGSADVDGTGNAGDNAIIGNDGDNTLTGNGGNDQIDGGAGIDTAAFADTLQASDFAFAGSWTVQSDTQGIDNLTNVEVVEDGAGHRFLLVGSDGFATLAAAVAAAQNGDTIVMASGEYDGNVNIDKSVTITAADGADVVIKGPLLSLIGSAHLDDYFIANHPAYSAVNGLTVAADDVTITGLTFKGFSNAISIGTSDGTTITDNHFIDNVNGIHKGTAQVVTNADISDNLFEHGVFGMTIYAGIASNGSGGYVGLGSFDQVTMDNNDFSNLTEKGLYIEQMSNLSATGNSFDDVGNYGRLSPPFGGTDGEFGQAIDINLKYGAYANVVFTDTEITNSGHSDRDGAGLPGAFGAAIGIKTRDDGGDYGRLPATFNGQITFVGGSIDDTSTGIRVGEPGKNNLGPHVLVDGMLITDASESDVANVSHPTNGGIATIEMAAAQIDLDASASQAPVHVVGNAHDNHIAGGTGVDDFTGGDGNDTYVVTAGDVVHEDADKGTDSVESSSSYTLAANVENLTLTGAANSDGTGNDLANTLSGNTGDNTLTGFGGADILNGGDGADILVGGQGNDSLDGGSGIDTAVFSGVLANYVISPSAMTVTDSVGSDGTDTIENVDILQFSNARVLIVGEGGFTSIQQALNAASNDDVIFVEAGTYAESLNITKSVTLLGANFGQAGSDGTGGLNAARGAETIISNAGWTISANNVRIDGFDFSVASGPTSPVQVGNVTGAAVANNIMTGPGNAGGRGVELVSGFTGTLSVDRNYIDHFSTGVYVNPVSGGTVSVTDNILSNNLAGIGSSGLANATITGNYFVGNTSEAIGADTLGAGNVVNNNSFSVPTGAYAIKADYTPGETDTLFANGNWYGTTDLAVIRTLVSSNVLAANYLTTGTDAQPTQAGFDGNGVTLPTPVQNTSLGMGGFLLAPIVALAAAGNVLTVAAGEYGGEGPITVNANNLSINGAAGANGIFFQMGLATNLTLLGSANINVAGDANTETITGNTGNNVFFGSAGGDTLNGGGGFDVLDYGSQTSAVNVQFDVGGFGVAAGGGIGVSQISGFEGVRGGSGNDQLIGDAQNNTFYASAGNDTIDGAGGTNTYNASDQTSAVFISLATHIASGSGVGSDSLANIANATGGSANDIIVGDGNANALYGGGGNDNITGGDGNDTLNGDDGDDTLNGGIGNDAIYGGAGVDTLIGGAGSDAMDGGTGFDTVDYSGSSQSAQVQLWNGGTTGGAAAGDTFQNIERVVGTAFADTIEGASHVGETFEGGAGDDILYGYGGNDTLNGGDGVDRLYGGNNDDTLIGGNGADVLDGGNGFDTADYSSAAQSIQLEMWNGGVRGGAATGDTFASIERVVGTAFNDTIGGASNISETLEGGAGNDILKGYGGDDTLIGGAGADDMDGGAGFDTVDYSGSSQSITLQMWSGGVKGGAAAGDALWNIEHVIGTNFGDSIYGNGVNETLEGGAGNDTLKGYGGDDTLIGGAGADDMDGGTGFDTVDYSGSSQSIQLEMWSGGVKGGAAAGDALWSIEHIIGTNFDDFVYGSGVNETIEGGIGKDSLHGAGGNDTVNGGAGEDLIYGNLGQDILIGGTGADQFFFDRNDTGQIDKINDFENNIDRIDLTSFAATTVSTIDADSDIFLVNNGADTDIFYNNGVTLEHFATVLNVVATDLIDDLLL